MLISIYKYYHEWEQSTMDIQWWECRWGGVGELSSVLNVPAPEQSSRQT